MNFYLVIILSFYSLFFLVDSVVDILNVRHIQTRLPDEFKDVYDSDKYEKSQEYLREQTRFSLIKSLFKDS